MKAAPVAQGCKWSLLFLDLQTLGMLGWLSKQLVGNHYVVTQDTGNLKGPNRGCQMEAKLSWWSSNIRDRLGQKVAVQIPDPKRFFFSSAKSPLNLPITVFNKTCVNCNFELYSFTCERCNQCAIKKRSTFVGGNLKKIGVNARRGFV